jgi:hypothetical protein
VIHEQPAALPTRLAPHEITVVDAAVECIDDQIRGGWPNLRPPGGHGQGNGKARQHPSSAQLTGGNAAENAAAMIARQRGKG